MWSERWEFVWANLINVSGDTEHFLATLPLFYFLILSVGNLVFQWKNQIGK